MDEAQVVVAEEKTAAAYLPFKTFLSAFDVFDHGVPHRIDRSIWRNQSGVVQSQIIMAFRFFRLIDESDSPRPALEKFVLNKDKRKEYVGALLQHSYRSILDHDLTKTTPKMLNDDFDQYRVSGDTKRKAIAFFLQAAQYAELPMHPLLNTKTRTSNAVSRKRRKVGTPGGGKSAAETADVIPPDPGRGETKSIRLRSGAVITLQISANWLELPADERKFVFELIDLFQSSSATVAKSDGEAA